MCENERETERERDRETETERQTERQTERETDRERDKQRERERERQTERERETNRERERERQRNTGKSVFNRSIKNTLAKRRIIKEKPVDDLVITVLATIIFLVNVVLFMFSPTPYSNLYSLLFLFFF